jgi:hypothetical protein
LCGYLPVRIVDLLGQHTGVETKALVKVTPGNDERGEVEEATWRRRAATFLRDESLSFYHGLETPQDHVLVVRQHEHNVGPVIAADQGGEGAHREAQPEHRRVFYFQDVHVDLGEQGV